MPNNFFDLDVLAIASEYLKELSPNAFKGAVAIRDEASGQITILLDPGFDGTPPGSYAIFGGKTRDGYLVVRDKNQTPMIILDGKKGDITVRHVIGGTPEDVFRFNGGGASLSLGGKGQDGDIWINDDKGSNRVHVDGSGSITILPGTAQLPVVTLASQQNNGTLTLGGKGSISLHAQTSKIVLSDTQDDATIELDGQAGGFRVKRRIGVNMQDALRFDGSDTALHIGGKGNEGHLTIRDSQARDVLHVDGAQSSLRLGTQGNGGEVLIYDSGGHERIRLDGNTGDIRLQGADVAEQFDLETSESVSPGTVLVIGETGGLRPCDEAYDRRVAGVLSGAGNTSPGIVLGHLNELPNRRPVALNGTANCMVDAQYGAIAAGDLLTTSPTSGCAMKAANPSKSFGALLGKSLGSLPSGRGMIPVLVALQ